ncbi:MAG: Nif3-like dinuclear metal center hexameric protein [Turicibacter sp.]|nr:Nif3-like dinuclear metal center hexameric protein [Turicibacter sp.]
MKAKNLYKQLDNDFIKPNLTDNWLRYMPELAAYICDSFKIPNRNMGIMCDFTETINHVYTAVFPSESVLQKISENAEKALLFVHHAAIWNLEKSPKGFYNMNIALLEKLKNRQIAIYCLHNPLDNFSEYSTSKTLADALNIEIIKPFAEHNGGLCGVIGKTNCRTVKELQGKFSEIVGHKTKFYQYGDSEILGNVAICAGGGNDIFVVEDMLKNGVKTLITGISVKNEFSAAVHEFEEKNQINVLGGTHYSTEKFACLAMCGYFEKLGISAEFVEDLPNLTDI